MSLLGLDVSVRDLLGGVLVDDNFFSSHIWSYLLCIYIQLLNLFQEPKVVNDLLLNK